MQVCSLGEEAHLNTCFKHFTFFVRVGAHAWPWRPPHGCLPPGKARLRQPPWLLCPVLGVYSPPWRALLLHAYQWCDDVAVCMPAWRGVSLTMTPEPAGPLQAHPPLTTPPSPAARLLQHFALVDDKELAPLQELIDQFSMGRTPAQHDGPALL